MRYVTFTSHEVNLTVRVGLAGAAKPIGHHGEGWQQVQRMMKMSFTEWQGSQGWELQIPIVFDGLNQNKSQESAIRTLEMLSVPWHRFKPRRTPLVIIDAQGSVPHDIVRSPEKQWVITSIDWDENYVTNERFHRVQQLAVVNVWEWYPEAIMKVKSLKPNGPAQKVPKTYKIKKGDTLQKIAARFYGDQSVWRQIAKLNNIRDPNHLKVGKVIKLPQTLASGGAGLAPPPPPAPVLPSGGAGL